MKASGLQRRRRQIRLLVLAGMVGLASAGRSSQWALPVAWLDQIKLDDTPEFSTGVQVEGQQNRSTVNGSESKYEQLSITPLLGMKVRGSIYHPNLCTFSLNGEAGWSWNDTTSKGTDYKQDQNDSGELQNYLAQFNFLQAKPYNANFFAAQDHSYRDYGDFSSMTVDSTRYGGGFNYTSDPFTLTTDAGYWREENTGITGYSEISQTYFNLTAVNLRDHGQTTLTTRANEYGNKLNNNDDQNSQNFGVSVGDSETLGARRHINLTSGASYGHAEYSGQQLDEFNANQNVNINHSETLDSYGNADYTYTDLQSTDAASINRVLGQYGARHQLYESLTSGLEGHGYYEENKSGGTATYDYYGVGWTEDYDKRLQRWGRLSAGSALTLNHQDNDSSGGPITTIDEPHVLTLSGPPTFLDKPNVIQSSVVVRTPGGVVCTPGVDYNLVEIGDLTQILLVPTSIILSNGDPILVTYQSENDYNASYESLNGSFNIRLDLYDHFGVYVRLNWMENNAPSNVQVESLTDWILGTDYTWRWFRAGAEYEDYISNFTKYQAARCFQQFNFHPTSSSTAGVNFNESRYRYSGSNDQNQYSVLGHYDIRFLGSLAWFVEGGFIYLQVFDDDQKTGTARTGLTWTRGKMSARLGYEFSGQYSGSGNNDQEFIRNYFYLGVKRTF
jgi:hypothetical protein